MYLMDKLKKKFESEDHEINPQELNYKVGNTSGLDIGQVPSDLARRVGELAQRGGGEMEIQVENPTSYHINRQDLYHTIQDLGLDVSFHADPNVGFTSMYKTGQGRGFDVTHNYFTNYLQEFASFKKEKEERDDIDFRISRINPHISTDEEPPLQERMAQDVGLDPFGYPISEYNDEFREMRDEAGKNIFRNEDFLENFYKAFILSEVDDEYQIYGLFQRFSPKFRQKWREAQDEAANQFWQRITDVSNVDPDRELSEKAAMVQSARMQDQGIDVEWLEIINNKEKLELNSGFEIPEAVAAIATRRRENRVPQEIKDLSDFQKLGIPIQLARIGNAVYQLENEPLLTPIVEEVRDEIQNNDDIDGDEKQRFLEQLDNVPDDDEMRDAALGLIEDGLQILWEGNGKDFLISVDTKLGVLQSRLDIQQTQILERAQEEDLTENAIAVMRGNKDYFEAEGAEEKTPEQKHQDLLKQLINSFEQAMWMESNLFHKIIPAWMEASNNEFTDEDGGVVHEAFEAPEFIWKVLVERNHGGVDFGNGFVRRLEQDEDFKKDVQAASAAVAVWSHFTQVESEFKMDGNQYMDQDYREACTWVRWMNDYGIGVNMEAMNGSANSHFKLWRPKDMVTACRAVNITARNMLDKINENLYGCPMKFTIDMEHTSSFGVDPWKQMEELIEQEKWLAKNNDWGLPVDEERPLSEMVRMYHLTKPGHESSQGTGHIHGPFRHGDIQLYTWLHDMVKKGFAHSDERASVMYEVGGEMSGTVQKAKLSMNMIELGIEPDKVDPARVNPGEDYQSEEEALIARFFGMDRPSFNQEWAKIEQHAFDPLEGVLEATNFNHSWTSTAALDRGNRPQEFQPEEYR
mgnify:FL=1